ncbi:Microcystin-dependent protein [Bizionia echini]|uniref:Microcystin-dependent protein n=1 Tax=Bizionia echini TaxID=649333 RepID=A0A1I4YVW4_9FLAO|nr:tail fiber protein [Bizionia echini]SFN42196.1 Microcystin-dependent protein [Bizionia echini]
MESFLAQIIMFAGNFAPRGWAYCNGQLLSINQYSALYSLLGNTYGGDGRTTFALPDLRGRLPKGMGQGAGLQNVTLGALGGKELVTLSVQNMPSHSHDGSGLSLVLACNEDDGDTNEPTGKNIGISESGTPYNTSANDAAFGNGTVSGSTGLQGNNQSFDVQNPFVGINYIISLEGIFPSRN